MEELISVVFIDARTQEEFGRSQIPSSQLPESFLGDTTLHIRDEEWSVVDAKPNTSAEFRLTGRLVLQLARIERLPPQDILFSLPSISNELPAIVPGDLEDGLDSLDLHEDDWRQVELVSAQFERAVREEVDLIRRVYEETSVPLEQGVAFRECHVRRGVPTPIAAGVRYGDIASPAAIAGSERHGLQMSREGGRIIDGFAFRLAGLWLYGQSHNGEVGVLAIHSAPEGPAETGDIATRALIDLMRLNDLLLVDWCRCFVTAADPAVISKYLNG